MSALGPAPGVPGPGLPPATESVVLIALPSHPRRTLIGAEQRLRHRCPCGPRKRTAPSRVRQVTHTDRKSTRLNSSHVAISYADCCLKKKNNDLWQYDEE